MKYRNYTVEDYIVDKDFVRWVKKPRASDRLLWESWMNSNPDHRDKIIEARAFILSMKAEGFEPDTSDFREVLDRIMKNTRKETRPVGYHSWETFVRISPFWRVAAILALAFSVSFGVFRSNQTDVVTQVADTTEDLIIRENQPKQRSNFNLPDGSLVWLNGDSKISYSVTYGNENRIIHLEGEAFFQVAKDESLPFVVKSGSIYTQALGTSFNVNTRKGDLQEIALVSGSIRVKSRKNEVVVKPGEKVIHKSDIAGLKVSEYNALEVLGWKDGILHFQNSGFHDIKRRLEQWYDVQIVVIGTLDSNWNYTGTFHESSLERVLERISYTKEFSYSIKNDVVTIKLNSL
ncbi:MAG: FecR domain-containing protein [Cyclobacteriaceae bacterium]|nr:FecR domain-containing protein [Cyclobacteriaceae bacterium]